MLKSTRLSLLVAIAALMGISACDQSEDVSPTDPIESDELNVAASINGAIATDNGSFDDYGTDQDAMLAIDESSSTYWAGLQGSSPQVATVMFSTDCLIWRIEIEENRDGSYYTEAEFEIYSGSIWIPLLTDYKSSAHATIDFAPRSAQGIRMKVMDLVAPGSWYNQVACVHEIRVLGEFQDGPSGFNVAAGSNGATATDNGSFDDYGTDQDAILAIDENSSTYWAGLQSASPQIITIMFSEASSIWRLEIEENRDGSHYTEAQFEILSGASWTPLMTDSKSTADAVIEFSPVTAQGIRMKINDLVAPGSWYNKVACISEFRVIGSH